MPTTIVPGILAAAALFNALTLGPVWAQTITTGPRESTAGMKLKTESFDHDPGWLGVNNRIAQMREPTQVRQDFGFRAETRHAGGASPGEMGGFITPDGRVAFYGKAIETMTLDQPLSTSGTMAIGQGGTHLLLGFFNSDTVNEWRTPNTLAIRLNGRGDKFFAYVEYCTSKWRAGGDTTPFPSASDPKTGRLGLVGFPCDKSFKWTLSYDPQGNNGRGVVTATIGEHMAICNLDGSHKRDGASFNHFGIMNVMKSVDSGSEVWFDDVAVNGSAAETFAQNPKWDGRNNCQTMPSKIVLLQSGQVLSGIKVAENETTLTLADNLGQKQVVAKADIEEQKASLLSTMPEGLEKRITEEEFVDLIAFLSSLKEQRMP
jgi:hypothetical protein